MDHLIRKELDELRSSDRRTQCNMREMFMEYYPATEVHHMLARLYAGWFLDNLELASDLEQAGMYRFYKWLSILIEADHLLQRV